MKSFRLVLSVLAQDRPGIVERISQAISSHEGTWLDSRLSRIGGWFGGLVEVRIPQENVDSFTAILEGLGEDEITVVTRASREEEPASRFQFEVEIVGNEDPGIIDRISSALSSRQINVDELQTDFYSAPGSGTPIFEAHLTGAVQQRERLSGLRDLLEGIASELMVDIEIRQVDDRT